MVEFKKIESIKPTGVAEINWNITSKCNYSCSYCCARECNKHFEGYDIPVTKLIEITETLKTFPRNFNLVLLGGEPIMSDRFSDKLHIICRELEEKATVTVMTNGSMPMFLYEELKRIQDCYGNLRIGFSYHAEECEIDKFIKNIKVCIDSGIPTGLAFMPHWSQKFLSKMREDFDKLKDIPFARFAIPTLAEDTTGAGEEFPMKYDPEIIEWVRSKALSRVTDENIYVADDKTYYEFNLITEGLTTFDGYKCDVDCWEVNQEGLLTKRCFPLPPINLCEKKDLKHLAHFTTTCRQQVCTCDALLRAKKWKE